MNAKLFSRYGMRLTPSPAQSLAAAVAVGNVTPVPTKARFTDREMLRALIEDADLLGHDLDGAPWLLIRTTTEMIHWLAAMDAAYDEGAEDPDLEPNGDHEHDDADDEPNGDMELDLADFEPDDREPLSVPLGGGADARPTALSITGGACYTPKPDLSLLPRSLRKQVRAATAKRKASARGRRRVGPTE